MVGDNSDFIAGRLPDPMHASPGILGLQLSPSLLPARSMANTVEIRPRHPKIIIREAILAITGTLLVAVAALCWGLAGGVGGLLVSHGWDPLLVSFYRGAIGLLFVAIWLAARRQASGLSDYRLWAWSLLAGLGVAGNFGFYFISIAQGSIAVAATLMYCAPLFVYLISFATGLEKPTAPKWATMPLVILGIVLLTQIDEVGASSVSAVGVGAGLLSGLSYALFIFSFKSASLRGSPQAILTIAFTVLALLTIVLFWPSQPEQIFKPLQSADWRLFVALGIFGAGLSFAIYIAGLKHTPPAVASVVAMLEPVTAMLFGVLVLREGLDGSQITGMVLILLSVTALSTCSAREKSGQNRKARASNGEQQRTGLNNRWVHPRN